MGNVVGGDTVCNAACINPAEDELSFHREALERASIEETDIWPQSKHEVVQGQPATVPKLSMQKDGQPSGKMALGDKACIVKGAHVVVVDSFKTAGKGNNIELKPGEWGKVMKIDPRDGQALIDFPGHRYNAYWVSPSDFRKMHAQAPTPRFGFDLTKLDASLRAGIEEEGRGDVTFLVMGGDFCPVHSEQLNGFELAKQFLEDRGHRVVIGLLGIADDPSDSGPRELAGMQATREHRMAMCRVAAAGTTWLQEVPWSWTELEELRCDLEQRILVLAKRTASKKEIGAEVKVTGYLLVGANLFCSLPQGSRDALHHALILSHAPHDEAVQQLCSKDTASEVHVVPGGRAVSAENLRSQINAGAWDKLRATEDLPQGVGAYLDRNFGRRRKKPEDPTSPAG